MVRLDSSSNNDQYSEIRLNEDDDNGPEQFRNQLERSAKNELEEPMIMRLDSKKELSVPLNDNTFNGLSPIKQNFESNHLR